MYRCAKRWTLLGDGSFFCTCSTVCGQNDAFAVMPAWSELCFNAINQSMQSLINELYASSGILVRAERSYVFLCTDV